MTNRLASATSPYLQQHAENPVCWWEWSPEALAEAKRLDKPILLSVGYAPATGARQRCGNVTVARMAKSFWNFSLDGIIWFRPNSPFFGVWASCITLALGNCWTTRGAGDRSSFTWHLDRADLGRPEGAHLPIIRPFRGLRKAAAVENRRDGEALDGLPMPTWSTRE